MTYEIVRHYKENSFDNVVIKTGLTLEEAREHCHDPETSSSTCEEFENTERTRKMGHWFDGYREE